MESRNTSNTSYEEQDIHTPRIHEKPSPVASLSSDSKDQEEVAHHVQNADIPPQKNRVSFVNTPLRTSASIRPHSSSEDLEEEVEPEQIAEPEDNKAANPTVDLDKSSAPELTNTKLERKKSTSSKDASAESDKAASASEEENIPAINSDTLLTPAPEQADHAETKANETSSSQVLGLEDDKAASASQEENIPTINVDDLLIPGSEPQDQTQTADKGSPLSTLFAPRKAPESENPFAVLEAHFNDSSVETNINEKIADINKIKELSNKERERRIEQHIEDTKERIEKAVLFVEILTQIRSMKSRKVPDWKPLTKMIREAQEIHIEYMSTGGGKVNFYGNIGDILKLRTTKPRSEGGIIATCLAYLNTLEHTENKTPIQHFLWNELTLQGNLFYDMHRYLALVNQFKKDPSERDRKLNAFIELLAVEAPVVEEKPAQPLENSDDIEVNPATLIPPQEQKYRGTIMDLAGKYQEKRTSWTAKVFGSFSKNSEFAELMKNFKWGQLHAVGNKLPKDRAAYQQLLDSQQNVAFVKFISDQVNERKTAVVENTPKLK